MHAISIALARFKTICILLRLLHVKSKFKKKQLIVCQIENVYGKNNILHFPLKKAFSSMPYKGSGSRRSTKICKKKGKKMQSKHAECFSKLKRRALFTFYQFPPPLRASTCSAFPSGLSPSQPSHSSDGPVSGQLRRARGPSPCFGPTSWCSCHLPSSAVPRINLTAAGAKWSARCGPAPCASISLVHF